MQHSVIIAEKHLLVPDCDDDRAHWDERHQFANRHHVAAQRRVYATGRLEWVPEINLRAKAFVQGDLTGHWSPPLNLRIEPDGTRREVYRHTGESLKGTRAGVKANWYQWPVDPENNDHITIWGGDDTYLERVRMPTEKARRIWEMLNDFVTIKTLWRLGFTVT